MTKSISIGALIAFALLSSGCIRPGSHFQDIAAEVVPSDESFDTQIELRVGGFPIWLAGFVTGFIDEPEVREASVYLDSVYEVEVGVYKPSIRKDRDLKTMARSIHEKMEKRGFELIVRVREDEELVTVYLPKGGGEKVEEGFVVVVGPSEIVLVKAEADFEEIAEAAIERHGFPVDMKEEFAANW